MSILLKLALFSSLMITLSCSDQSSLHVENQQGGAGDTTENADIIGRVLDVQGQPVAGAVVVTTPYGRSATTDANGRKFIDEFLTDAAGDYIIPLQAFGSYTLKVMASGYQLGTRSVATVDFLPQNLISNKIVKNITLSTFPQLDDGDTPAVALFDVEDKKRMTEFLTSKGIRFESIVNRLDNLDIANYRVLIIGADATVYSAIGDLIAHKAGLAQFIDNGGHVAMGQLNDFSVEGIAMPFFQGERAFFLHIENAPFNDFQTGIVRADSHPLVQGVTFLNWSFIEPGQEQVKTNVSFDAAIKSSFTGPNWTIIATTPAADFVGSTGTVSAEADVILAEYIDPVGGGSIIVNQSAFYQAAFGDLSDPNAVILADNFARYIKHLNGGP